MNRYSILYSTPNGDAFENVEASYCLKYDSGRCDLFDERDRLVLSVENVYKLRIDHDDSEEDPVYCEDCCSQEPQQPVVNEVTFNGLKLNLNPEETERLRLFLKYML